MQLSESPESPKEQRTRTITPDPEEYPEFSIELRDLTKSEYTRICDRHGYFPGGNRNTVDAAQKVIADTVKKRVVRVNGATDKDVALDPAADSTKLRLLDPKNEIEVGGKRMQMWSAILVLEAAQIEAEEKN